MEQEMRTVIVVLAALSALISCAPPGYKYEQWSFVPRAIDACARPETSTGLMGYLNRKIGVSDGPKARVISIQGLVLSGELNEGHGAELSCHGTLILENGQTQTGLVSARDPGGYAPLEVRWYPDPTELQKLDATRQPQEQKLQSDSVNTRSGQVLIEQDAVLFDNSKDSIEMIEQLVDMVRSSGYVCDSVSGARPMIWTPGYVLTCNRFRYTYDIEDKGGTPIVIVE